MSHSNANFITQLLALVGLDLIFVYSIKELNVVFLLTVIIFLLLVDFKTIFTFKNYTLFYLFILLVWGSMIFYRNTGIAHALWIDFITYSLMFSLGYSFFYILPQKKASQQQLNLKGLLKLKRILEKMLITLLFIIFCLFIISIFRVGLVNFYAGKELVETVESYGKRSNIGGLKAIFYFILNTLIWAVSIFYISICYIADWKPRMGYLIGFFVLFPLFSLSRGAFVFGILFVIFSSFIIRKKIELWKFIGVVILIFFIGVSYGLIREAALLGATSVYSYSGGFLEKVMQMVRGEISPVIAYVEIKENITNLNYQYGKTIFLPLALKIVPRAFWPGKPYNTSAYFMYQLHKESAEAGFFLAPSILGDTFLNFGYIGCIIFMFFMGVFGTYFDCMIRLKKSSTHHVKIALMLLMFSSYYSILRNNISDSVFGVSIIYITILALSYFFRHYIVIRTFKGSEDENRN